MPDSLLEKIKAKATASAPAGEVVQTTAQPISQSDKPTPTPTGDTPPKPPTTTPKAEAAGGAPVPTKPPTPEAVPDKPAKKSGIDELREAHERNLAKLKELEASHTTTAKEKADAYAKLAETEAKVKGYEEKFAKEYEPQLKRLTEREQELARVQEQLRVKDYTATPEFHNAYVKPIVDVQQEALQFIGELVRASDGAPAGQAELNHVLSAPNANEAARRAEELFGNQPVFTGQLVNYRTRLRALQNKHVEAQQKATVESETFFKNREQEQLAAHTRFRQAVDQRMQAHLIKVAEADPEEAAAYAAGQQWAAQVDTGSSDPEQWADMVARVKASSINEKVKDLRLKRQADELATLKAELEAYRRSEPVVETSGGGAPGVEVKGDLDSPAGQGVSHADFRDKLLQKLRKSASYG